jgi:hypothetical protein
VKAGLFHINGIFGLRGAFFHQFSNFGVMTVLIFGMSLLPVQPVSA